MFYLFPKTINVTLVGRRGYLLLSRGEKGRRKDPLKILKGGGGHTS